MPLNVFLLFKRIAHVRKKSTQILKSNKNKYIHNFIHPILFKKPQLQNSKILFLLFDFSLQLQYKMYRLILNLN